MEQILIELGSESKTVGTERGVAVGMEETVKTVGLQAKQANLDWPL